MPVVAVMAMVVTVAGSFRLLFTLSLFLSFLIAFDVLFESDIFILGLALFRSRLGIELGNIVNLAEFKFSAAVYTF